MEYCLSIRKKKQNYAIKYYVDTTKEYYAESSQPEEMGKYRMITPIRDIKKYSMVITNGKIIQKLRTVFIELNFFKGDSGV